MSLAIFQATVADGYYIVTPGGRAGWQWRGAGQYNEPFPTRGKARQAANLDRIPAPWYIGRATSGVVTAVIP